MAAKVKILTVEELDQVLSTNKHTELVRGELRQKPLASQQHGELTFEIGLIVGTFVRQHRLGKMYAAETGFVLARNPDSVRAPDIAFVSADRVVTQPRRDGFFEGAPDLAIEVVSPGDTDSEVAEKVLDYLRAGVRLVWIVRPRSQTVTAHRSLKEARTLTAEEMLEGEDVLPGFRVPVADLFASL
ncbi:MAG: Uma2 family endonuclease [Roseiflexaceae bacterium]